jgi:hypothetical protein
MHLKLIFLSMMVLLMAACGGETAVTPPTAPPPTPNVAADLPVRPPRVRNTVPAGDFPDNVSGEIVANDTFLFQMHVFDENVGGVDGAGITAVEFIVRDDAGNVVYRKTESTANYCIFGGGTPDCAPWTFEDGVLKWFPGGLVVQPGHYFAEVQVMPQDAAVQDPNFPSRTLWGWFFEFTLE